MRAPASCPPRHGEGYRAQRGGGASRFKPRLVVTRARDLRKHLTKPELALWQQRRTGLELRRQHPIGPCIVDFHCLRARLVIEVNGIAHDIGGLPARDAERENLIKENGFRVLRVSGARAMADAEGAAVAIAAYAEGPLRRPTDGPPPRAGEDK
ncbi:MAG TPA: DUF559 domain-containing protein [Novosphingobium sp.]|nr:DUF559 domain-containing protein [Novosphingobium sp.]